jgi:hypothetical protein
MFSQPNSGKVSPSAASKKSNSPVGTPVYKIQKKYRKKVVDGDSCSSPDSNSSSNSNTASDVSEEIKEIEKKPDDEDDKMNIDPQPVIAGSSNVVETTRD